jgi:hypothetical protein
MRSNRYNFGRLYNDKPEYDTLCQEYKNELESVGINHTISNTKINVINADLTRLCSNLFDLVKFENSKPYKMIDYILQNDMSLYNPDKKKIEEIKKIVFNYQTSKHEDNPKTPIFKSLYQQFKSDFSHSTLFKLIEKLNKFITESYLITEKVNISVKDKFTYQSYLYERMKANENILTQMYDHEIFKALIYVSNKNLKYNASKQKVDVGLTNIMLDKLDQMKGPFLYNHIEDIKERLSGNDKCLNFIRKKFNRMFRKLKNKQPNTATPEERKILNNKFLEYVYRYKEDDFEKLNAKVSKFEDEYNFSGKGEVKNMASHWIMFRFLIAFEELEKGKYFTDELFWKLINDYIKDNAVCIPKPVVEVFIPKKTKAR